jgi:hypothetical protein
MQDCVSARNDTLCCSISLGARCSILDWDDKPSPDLLKDAFYVDDGGWGHVAVFVPGGSSWESVGIGSGTGTSWKSRELSWDPTSTRLAYYSTAPGLGIHADLFCADLATRQVIRLTTNPAEDYGVTWLDADRLEYCQERDGKYETYAVNWDGTNRQKVRDDCPVRR